jgi:hypothetical protein
MTSGLGSIRLYPWSSRESVSFETGMPAGRTGSADHGVHVEAGNGVLIFMRALIVATGIILSGCAALQTLGVIPLRISDPADRQAELRILGPATDRPLGGAALRLWARVENPNRFGVTLRDVVGAVHIADAEALAADFPLGLPLAANQDTVIPFDIAIRFDNVPRLASVIRSAITGTPLPYRLEGSFGVEAGNLGSPRFGPMTLLRGEIRVR